MHAEEEENGQAKVAQWALVLAPLAAILFALCVDLKPGEPIVTYTAAVAMVMAVWWITGALPLAATSMLPLVLFPLLSIMPAKEVAPLYLTDITFLYMGGFLVALAMERWDLHRRMALRMMMVFGVRPRMLLLGFLAPTFAITMWITNSAATMMMLPIATSIIASLEEQIDARTVRKYAAGLYLGIAYSASIGGAATLIGTPTNLSFTRMLALSFPNAPEITFAQWFLFSFPTAIVLEAVLWIVLAWQFCPREMKVEIAPDTVCEHYRRLGPMSIAQKLLLAAFLSMACLWFTRAGFDIGSVSIPGWASLFPKPSYISDGTVAMSVALLLFLLPARDAAHPGARILDWDTAKRVPWDIVLLFGGGFALAQGFVKSGLSEWVGGELTGLGGLHPLVVVIAVTAAVCFLSELTSNVATAEMVLPILAALAVAIHVHPFLLMIPATLAASYAFMLPAGTPPNAIAYGTGKIQMGEMVRTGFILNLAGIVIVTLGAVLLGRAVFGVDLAQLPAWALPPGK